MNEGDGYHASVHEKGSKEVDVHGEYRVVMMLSEVYRKYRHTVQSTTHKTHLRGNEIRCYSRVSVTIKHFYQI